MGRISTHVLDVARGRPGAGIEVTLARQDEAGWVEIARATTNADGRTDAALAEGDALRQGMHEIRFAVGAYFEGEGFLDTVPVRFRVDDADGHYHVPLLCSPWSYSTYRGS